MKHTRTAQTAAAKSAFQNVRLSRQDITGPAAGSVVEKQPPQPEVLAILSSQESGIANLQLAVSRLRERLSSVLIEIPTSGGTAEARCAPGSDMGRALDLHNERISEVTTHIEYITNQLAV